MVYLFDGSFEGVLSAVYEMFYAKANPDKDQLCIRALYQYDLFDQVVECHTVSEYAGKVTASIIETFGEEAFRRIGYAYLSEDEQFGTKLFRALKKAYKFGGNGLENYSEEAIMTLYKCYNAVARESHRMIGFIRFAELEKGIYYSQFEPTYDLLALVVPHFVDRLGDQLWVLHDTKRRKAAFYNKTEVHFSDLDPVESLYYSSREEQYQKMWQAYFDHIAIDERKDKRRHMQMMPKKYWQFLTEKKAK